MEVKQGDNLHSHEIYILIKLILMGKSMIKKYINILFRTRAAVGNVLGVMGFPACSEHLI